MKYAPKNMIEDALLILDVRGLQLQVAIKILVVSARINNNVK
jgi:hypothetical protein